MKIFRSDLISDKKNKNLILTDSMIDIVEYTRSLWAATVSFCAYNGYMTVSFSCYGAGKLPFTYVLRILGVSRLRRCRRNHLSGDFPTHLSLSLALASYDRSLARSRIDLVEAITRYTNKPINYQLTEAEAPVYVSGFCSAQQTISTNI